MLCRIADLFTEIPEAGDMLPRCQEYLWPENVTPDIILTENQYKPEVWPNLSYDNMVYMESGLLFYTELLHKNGLLLHASAIELNGYAYLFSGPCGVGKSTHARLWQQVFGSAAQVFNDDKPALRRLDGTWYAYGTPWCGKDGINQNKKVPLAGICFLKQSLSNHIYQLSVQDALIHIISQTRRQFQHVSTLDKMLLLTEQLAKEIPVFMLENRPVPNAAQLSFSTMYRKAMEAGL